MNAKQLSSSKILNWRRLQLSLGGRSADLDWLLDLAGGLKWNKLQSLYIDDKKTFALTRDLDELADLWLRHLNENVPLQYLVGVCPWRDFTLNINNSAMIPRQETELLIDFALKHCEKVQFGKWADLGTGSGAIAIALARALPDWEGYVVDISKEALELARENLQALSFNSKYSLYLGNWWDPLKAFKSSFDLVISNPPYIPVPLLKDLDPVVRDYEPSLAFAGGIDGLSCLRKIISGAYSGLLPGGCLMLEHHHDQSDKVLELISNAGLVNSRFELDLEGIKRFAIAFKPDKV